MGRSVDVKDWVVEIINRQYLPRGARTLATKLHDQMEAGITPAFGQIEKLQKMVAETQECSRLQEDGSCIWLRRHGEGAGLAVPPIGLKAMCPFGSTKHRLQCDGYAKPRN